MWPETWQAGEPTTQRFVGPKFPQSSARAGDSLCLQSSLRPSQASWSPRNIQQRCAQCQLQIQEEIKWAEASDPSFSKATTSPPRPPPTATCPLCPAAKVTCLNRNRIMTLTGARCYNTQLLITPGTGPMYLTLAF